MVDAFGGAATTTPAGKLSVKSRLLAATALAVLLLMVNVRVLTWPTTLESGAKTLANVGAGSMVRLAVAGPLTLMPPAERSLLVLGKVPTVAVAGTRRGTLIVHIPPAGSSPPVMLRDEVPVIVEPVPHMLLSGRPVASRPVITALRSSMKERPVTPAVVSRFVIVKVSVGVPVAVLGPSNVFVKVTSLVVRSSLAGSPVMPRPLIVPVTLPVVLVTVPGAVPAGTVRVTVNVHDAPAARLPPLKVSSVVPISVPLPLHIPAGGRVVAARPVRAAFRSSVNPIADAALTVSRFVMVNCRVTVPPVMTGWSVKDLLRSSSLSVTISSSPPEAGPPRWCQWWRG